MWSNFLNSYPNAYLEYNSVKRSMTFDFGIDLGTTNSVIARCKEGKVEVFKNPVGHKETLPSVVAFRKDRILIGDKAKEYLERDASNVFGSFKRKMGSSESFWVMNLEKTFSPIELSACVLRELKNFVYTGEAVDAAVITIPASFDTVQSNATLKAGTEAGFKEVLLLQEPIAASLAYANQQQSDLSEGQWLVYDLGGGTFDVALVKIADGEMHVLDHQGDNFLGGLDFDQLIVDQLVVPYLYGKGKFENLETEFRSAKGRYNNLYFKLLILAEEAKIALSNAVETEIEFEIEDLEGTLLEISCTITRQQFEELIQPTVSRTISMIAQMMERNQIHPSSLRFVLMVGGSTLIPLVRQMITRELGLSVNCGIDPTTAVAIGAAYYAAGRKRKQTSAPDTTKNSAAAMAPLKMAYQRSSQATEEYFVALPDTSFQAVYYRLIRKDGGFDTGIKKINDRIEEMLPLLKESVNVFQLLVLDAHQQVLPLQVPGIEIVQGKFSVLGQPLPNDICLEVDDPWSGGTRLEVIFEKNALLPLRRVVTKEILRTVRKGSDEALIIHILEGSRFSNPATNLPIGSVQISGNTISRDLLKGSDIELSFEMSESRELLVTTYLLMTDQEFQNTFNPSERTVSILKLKDEITELNYRIQSEYNEATSKEEYEMAGQLKQIKTDVELLHLQAERLSSDDVTDWRYQLDDAKRKLASTFDLLTRDKHLVEVKSVYFSAKSSCQFSVEQHGSDEDKRAFSELMNREKEVLSSGSKFAIEGLTDKLQQMRHRLDWKTPEYIIFLYYHFSGFEGSYSNESKAKDLILKGEKALERQNYDELRVVVIQLSHLV
ncbi:MAG: Hsp70 family protein [Cytophagaceae bacterium]|nr:Hsp70 family protein [Cytophagaceae bacterium]